MHPGLDDTQVVPAVPSAVQVSLIGQVVAGQLAPVQPTSHLQEPLQATLPHELLAVQLTVHGPSPHWMSLHAFVALHWIEHDLPLEQSMLSHALFALHWIVQA